ncbi:MAG: two-component system, sensor histidine kinase YesM [Epulopiscium sp.]|nr:two-component system, sensor histidine kinase YesM [Candidatus Epulonipiscium sp.]
MKHLKEKIKTWFYSKTLKQKLRFLFITLAVSYITIFFLIYSFFIKRNMIDYVKDNNYHSMISIGNNLNTEFGAVSTMSQLIMTDPAVVDYLKSDRSNSPRLLQNAMMTMYDIGNTFNYVSSIYVFRMDKNYVNVGREVTYINRNIIYDPKWQEEIIEKAGLYAIRVNGDGAFKAKSGKPVISFIRLINDLDTQKPIGFIVINLTTDILRNSFKDMTSQDRHFCYYDDQGNILLGDERVKEFQEMEIGQNEFEQVSEEGFFYTKILSRFHIPDTPFTIAKIEHLSFKKYFSSQAIMVITIIIALTIVCLIIIGIFISVYVANPLEKLVQYMDSLKLGWQRKESLRLSNNDAGYLKNIHNYKLIEINRLIDELLEKEKAMQKAELEVLREQINPHFLYNTLGTIADLALQNSADEVYDAIETLGNFYRRFLSKGSKEITIREEVAIVRDYLKLQKLRYEDVFEDEYDLQEDLLDIKIPKLILQPLVENSLYHGVRLKGEKGIIRVSVYEKDQRLHIVVYDSGVGMNPEQIQSLMNENNNKSFGLKGTIERIRYYYDMDDVFEIRSKEGEYCEVDIKIPL